VILDAETVERAIYQLINTLDSCLKQYEKQWKQVLSVRVFYDDQLEPCTDLFVKNIQKKSKHVPAITSIPVNGLGENGIIACTVHVL
jgi:enamine deaminase RidA (YjgF/YER057c/UK114 family)